LSRRPSIHTLSPHVFIVTVEYENLNQSKRSKG
jgi:hypothetical protein